MLMDRYTLLQKVGIYIGLSEVRNISKNGNSIKVRNRAIPL